MYCLLFGSICPAVNQVVTIIGTGGNCVQMFALVNKYLRLRKNIRLYITATQYQEIYLGRTVILSTFLSKKEVIKILCEHGDNKLNGLQFIEMDKNNFVWPNK